MISILFTIIDLNTPGMHSLAAIIVCQFTVELRRRCNAQATGSDLTQTMTWSTTTWSPRLVFCQVFERFHHSIQDDFGEHRYERNENSSPAEGLLEIKRVDPLHIAIP